MLHQPFAPLPLSAAQVAAAHESRHLARGFVRFLMAQARTLGTPGNPLDAYRVAWPRDVILDRLTKAAVSGATSENWGAPLMADNAFAGAFLELVRPAEVLGRMPGVRRVPPKVWVARQTGGSTAVWLTPGKPIPVSVGAFDRVELGVGELGAMLVATAELIRDSSPPAEELFSQDVQAACVEAGDRALLDPSWAGIPDYAPASITHDCFALPSTGGTVDAVAADVAALVQHMADAGVRFAAPVWVTTPGAIAAIAGMRSGGLPAFPGLALDGGTLSGIPVLGSTAAGAQLVLIDSAELLVADDGLDVTVSRVAALEISDAPTNDSGVPTGANLTSLLQTNSAAIKCVRRLWFEMGRDDAVARISGFTPGAP